MRDEERDEDQEPRRPRVVDKRRSSRPAEPRSGEVSASRGSPSGADPAVRPAHPEDTSTPPPPPAGAAPGQTAEEVWTPEQEAEARRMAEEIAATPTREWVLNAAVTMANVAGTKLQMGDPAEANLAIDTLSAILTAAGPRLEDAEQPLRRLLSQLQLLYAERVAGTS